MVTRLLALIKLKSAEKFLEFHEQIVPLVKRFNGTFTSQAINDVVYFDEIGNLHFDGVVEIQFPSGNDADNWATSEELRSLTTLRREAMDLTLMRIAG